MLERDYVNNAKKSIISLNAFSSTVSHVSEKLSIYHKQCRIYQNWFMYSLTFAAEILVLRHVQINHKVNIIVPESTLGHTLHNGGVEFEARKRKKLT